MTAGLDAALADLRDAVTQPTEGMALEFRSKTGQSHAQVKAMVLEAMRDPPKKRRDSMQIYRV